MLGEKFSTEHPVTVKDSDLFLHGTSSKKYFDIKRKGFLLRKVNGKNFSISQNGICFEKYDEHVTYAGRNSADFIEDVIRGYCETACRKDHSLEGVIVQIKGRELNKLGCKIYADWNTPYGNAIIRNSMGKPIGVDSNASVLPIIIVDKNIPFEYLKVFKRIHFKD